MADDLDKYPIPGFSFRVDFLFSQTNESKYMGPEEAAFMEVSGLKASLDLEEYPEMGFFGQPRALITGLRFDNLILKRGFTRSSKIAAWFKDCMYDQQTHHVSVLVSLLGSSKTTIGRPIAVWQFFEAYPVSIEYSGLNAMASGFTIETLELRYSYFTPLERRQKQPPPANQTPAGTPPAAGNTNTRTNTGTNNTRTNTPGGAPGTTRG